jgi:hypothetical protein
MSIGREAREVPHAGINPAMRVQQEVVKQASACE